MSVAELAALLERDHGLRFDALALGRLQRALARGDAAADPRALDDRARLAIEDPGLQAELLDRVTLQETSFFRDPPVFDDLATRVLPNAIRAARGGPLVVWSAGCANGQEAWTLAMLLAELGAPRFEVVATDLSPAATARARAGVYDERELRGLGAARRARFLVPAAGRWRVADALRPHVRVLEHNAATSPAPVPDGSCAVVLCRYVLIYQTPAAADALLAHVASALAPDGRLVIGAAESLWHLSGRFTPVSLPHAVAYRRRTAADGASPRVPASRGVAAASGPPRLPGGGHLQIGEHVAHPPGGRRTAPSTLSEDTGARARATPAAPDAAALLRQGELAAAGGRLADAAAAFRGAAYLDPDDPFAPAQLGLVLEAMGDAGARRAYRSAWAAVGRRPEAELRRTLGDGPAVALVRLLAEKLQDPA